VAEKDAARVGGHHSGFARTGIAAKNSNALIVASMRMTWLPNSQSAFYRKTLATILDRDA
jgi:hypothetical protein